MLLYTGMRQISIRRAKWQDFNIKKAIWYRQPEKGDSSVHELPLPKQAIELRQRNDLEQHPHDRSFLGFL